MPSYYYGDYDPLAGISQEQHDLILSIGTGTAPPSTQVPFSPTPVQPGQTWNPASVGPPKAAAPKWTYAVNMPSTYPDFAAMKASGQGLVVSSDDPNADALIAGAREWGIPVAINVAAPPGISPEEYARRVQAAKDRWNPDQLVLDIEAVGKGYEGSDGWNWSNQAATALKSVVGDTSVAVTMEPNQDDYNYKAYQGLGTTPTQFWVQAYLGDMTPVDVDAAVARVVANGVDASQVTAIVGPTQSPGTSGNYASYGIPQNEFGGVYGTVPGTSGSTNQPPPPAGTLPPEDSGAPGTPTAPGSGSDSPYVEQPPDPNADNDTWIKIYFGNLGLPPELVAEVDKIFAKYPDTNQAIQFALAYIRGTSWYAQTFPGIQYGIQHGLINDERDYRQYVTAIDQLSMQYWNKHISGGEIEQFLHDGKTPDLIGREYLGIANVIGYGTDYRYFLGGFGDINETLDDKTLGALGRQQAGIDTPLGLKLKRALDQAISRYQKVFEGSAGSPSLSLGNAGLNAPSLGGGKSPDVPA